MLIDVDGPEEPPSNAFWSPMVPNVAEILDHLADTSVSRHKDQSRRGVITGEFVKSAHPLCSRLHLPGLGFEWRPMTRRRDLADRPAAFPRQV